MAKGLITALGVQHPNRLSRNEPSANRACNKHSTSLDPLRSRLPQNLLSLLPCLPIGGPFDFCDLLKALCPEETLPQLSKSSGHEWVLKAGAVQSRWVRV